MLLFRPKAGITMTRVYPQTLQPSRNPELRIVCIFRQGPTIKAIDSLQPPHLLSRQGHGAATLWHLLKLETHHLNHRNDFLQRELHKGCASVQQGTKIDPVAPWFENPRNGVKVGHDVARRVDKEVRYHDVET